MIKIGKVICLSLFCSATVGSAMEELRRSAAIPMSISRSSTPPIAIPSPTCRTSNKRRHGSSEESPVSMAYIAPRQACFGAPAFTKRDVKSRDPNVYAVTGAAVKNIFERYANIIALYDLQKIDAPNYFEKIAQCLNSSDVWGVLTPCCANLLMSGNCQHDDARQKFMFVLLKIADKAQHFMRICAAYNLNGQTASVRSKLFAETVCYSDGTCSVDTQWLLKAARFAEAKSLTVDDVMTCRPLQDEIL